MGVGVDVVPAGEPGGPKSCVGVIACVEDAFAMLGLGEENDAALPRLSFGGAFAVALPSETAT